MTLGDRRSVCGLLAMVVYPRKSCAADRPPRVIADEELMRKPLRGDASAITLQLLTRKGTNSNWLV